MILIDEDRIWAEIISEGKLYIQVDREEDGYLIVTPQEMDKIATVWLEYRKQQDEEYNQWLEYRHSKEYNDGHQPVKPTGSLREDLKSFVKDETEIMRIETTFDRCYFKAFLFRLWETLNNE